MKCATADFRHVYDNFSKYNFIVGYIRAMPPIMYVLVDPIDQNAVDATIGPRARASAPNERKMPNTVPF